MILVSKPLALPGSCYFCGSGSRESYVDTQQQVEFHGAMYICNICGEGIGAMFGMMSKENADKLLDKMKVLETEKYNLKMENDGLKEANRGLTTARRYSDGNTSRPVAGFPKDSSGTEEGSSRGEEIVVGGTIQPPESTDDEGVDDVRPVREQPEFSLFG